MSCREFTAPLGKEEKELMNNPETETERKRERWKVNRERERKRNVDRGLLPGIHTSQYNSWFTVAGEGQTAVSNLRVWNVSTCKMMSGNIIEGEKKKVQKNP